LFELSEGDVRLPKLFRQTVPQRWPGGGKTAVTELVAWSLDQTCSTKLALVSFQSTLNLIHITINFVAASLMDPGYNKLQTIGQPRTFIM